MFDYVKFDALCVNCKKLLSSFQSKDGECQLLTITPESLRGGCFYAECECGAWNEYLVSANGHKIALNTGKPTGY